MSGDAAMMQIDPQCSFLVGSAMALVSRRRLRRATPRRLAETRNVVLAFTGAVFAPVWIYITLRWTGWETMYVWDADTVPLWLVAVFLPLLSLTALVGFHVTQTLVRRDRTRAAIVIFAAVAASCVAIAGVGWDRVTYVGDVAGYRAGERANILSSDLLLMFGVGGVLVFGPTAALVIHWLKGESESEVI